MPDIVRKGLDYFGAWKPCTKGVICIRFSMTTGLGNTSSISPIMREQTNNLSPFGFSLSETTDKNDLDVNKHIKSNSFICEGGQKL